MTSLRFENLDSNVQLEALAPNINLEWNPLTNDGYVTFHVQKYLRVNSSLRGDVRGGTDTVRIPIASIMQRCLAVGSVDPVTQQPLGYVSGAGLMLVIKRAFDTLYNEEMERRASALNGDQS